jgi:hypothetical protein
MTYKSVKKLGGGGAGIFGGKKHFKQYGFEH